jgi:hypothetical protein
MTERFLISHDAAFGNLKNFFGNQEGREKIWVTLNVNLSCP